MKLYRIIALIIVAFIVVGFYFTIYTNDAIDARLDDYVSIACLIMFVLLINQFLFDPSFRKDLSTGTSEVSIGKYSIKGGKIIVLAILLFIAGAAYPLIKSISSEHFQEDNYIKKSEMAEYVESINTGIAEIRKFTSDIYIKKSEMAEYVESMQYDDPQAGQIRDLQVQEKGPWSKLPKAEILIVTVPGHVEGHVEQGKANVCKEHYDNKYTLHSSTYGGKDVMVHANAYIIRANNCADIYTYDMQISCEDAELIFTSKILSCDEDGNPKWTNEAPTNRRLKLHAVPSNRQLESHVVPLFDLP